MFIDENVTKAMSNPYFAEATADPMYLMEAVQEANEAMHELSMKMIKCEHAAIINENQDMLAEAEGDFKAKAKGIVDTIVAKFFAFIDRVKAEWSKLWASILSKLVNTDKAAEMKAYVSKARISVKADMKRITSAKAVYDKVINVRPEDNYLTDAYNQIKSAMGEVKNTNATKTVATSDVDAAINFLKERPGMIKNLEATKRAAKAMQAKDVAAGDVSKDRLLVARYSSLMSKVISYVNGATGDAVRICRAASKAGKGTKAYAADQKAAKAERKENRKTGAAMVASGAKAAVTGKFGESASILDMF